MSRIVEDVREDMFVLLLGLDRPRPEAAAEDVIAPAVAMVESASVVTVEVAHSVRQAGRRSLEDKVVVVAEEGVGVNPPAVTELHPPEDVEEDRAILVVQCDRRTVVAASSDVVVGAGSEVAGRAGHCSDASRAVNGFAVRPQFRRASDSLMSRARHGTGPNQATDPVRGRSAAG